MIQTFSPSVSRSLKHYVYIYSHPETEEIFYVGKGKGNRVFAHLKDKKDSKKVAYINDLKAKGLKPKIEILIHGLEDDNTALRVEASVIDLIGRSNLTNKQGGFKSGIYGRMTLDQATAAYHKEQISVNDPAILIRISRGFRYSLSPIELYDCTRGQWRMDPNKGRKAKYAFAIYEGIIQEVYTPVEWFEAGKTFSLRPGINNVDSDNENILEGRFEFVGNLAPDKIRKKYKYKSVDQYFPEGARNPVRYVNIT